MSGAGLANAVGSMYHVGIGFELLKALYPTSARLYLAGRSESKGKEAIAAIKSHHADVRNGFLEFVLLDLGDLTTIKSSADDFLAREKRLDVLWLNAGVMIPPAGSKTTQVSPRCTAPRVAKLICHV